MILKIIIIIIILFGLYVYIQTLPINYCEYKKLKNTPLLSEQLDEDTEKMIPIIQKFAPIIYLHKEETAFPISMEEYLDNSEVKHKKTICDSVVIPKGEITMRKLYELKKDKGLYINIDDCKKLGSNPENNKLIKDHQKILTTPAYVKTNLNSDGTYLYLQFFYFYGFNSPVTIKDPIYNKTLVKGDIFYFQEAHEADIEKVCILINLKTNQIEKMYLSQHDSGLWLNQENIKFDKDTNRPIVFSALGSHANYPNEGISIRIFGFGNDKTSKKIRWEPSYCRIYSDEDGRFNPDIHGWIYFQGNYGIRGVAGLSRRKSFNIKWNKEGNDIMNEDSGKDYDTYIKNYSETENISFKQRWNSRYFEF